ncbi:N-acetyltransferase eco [Anopheles maculipalpis]|uniref:N-acetyltransferase eco n=1 Tax=Anopheles maculipalpis TaxID=1496333 RepID=UPI002158E899|nr:N-acetyltransferase eco [Anopheles maculipalpis]
METPRTAVNQAHRGHLRTPKMSSSKKSLFGKDVDDEADIGPMTPLRFGGHRRSTTKSTNALSNITSFRNLFGSGSPDDSDRSLSPDFATRFTNNGRYELLPADYDKENMNHPVDEETRFSFSSSIPETPTSRLSAEESAVLDENNSNSLSMLMNADLNLVEKHAKTLHRTPGVTTRSHSICKFNERSVDPTLRRTQHHLAGVKRAHIGTPDDTSQSPSCNRIDRSSAKRPNNTRARTALHFNDVQPIPTKSFYSSRTIEKDSPLKMPPTLSTKSFYASSSKLDTIPIPTRTSPENAHPKPSTNESKKTLFASKTPRKATTSMRKRSKSFSSSNAPRLGQRGTVHKIQKPVKKTPVTPKRKSPRTQQKNRAIAGGTKSCPTTPKSDGNGQEPDHADMLRKLNRVNSILQQGQKNLTHARPLSTSRSMTDLSKGYDDANLSSDEEEDSASEQEDGDGVETNGRKFFRSKHKTRSIRRVYNHFNSIVLGVKNGGKRKLLSFPQTSKRRRTAFEQDEFDYETEQLEVDDLISRLDDGAEERYCAEAGNDQHDDDDAPIPIQSNVIYLSADDEFELENCGVEENMDYQGANLENGTIIVQHGGSSGVNPQVEIVQCDESVFVPYDHYENVRVDGFMANSSTIIIQHNEYHTSSTINQNDSALSTTITSSSTVSQYHYETQCQPDHTPQPTATQVGNEYYPLFYPDRAKELWKQQTDTVPKQTDIFHLLRQQDNPTRVTKHGAGPNQYQIDAGQRVYGAIQCKECGLTYSTHEPEEELFHNNFHRSQAKLTFPGGANEHVVVSVPEWDVTGRIIVVSQTDPNRQLLKRIQGVLEVVDAELGFSTHGELPEGACIYMAIARSTVLGLCVVQPVQYANRMICLEGLHGAPIDCYSSEFYPAKCGISRLWVAPKYRRHGIGRKLVNSIRYHYIFGYTLSCDEIAFGAPTEMGKLFAESFAGRKDFLVYI